jgi:hypothetical protein
LLAAEREPALYVDAAEKERGVDAMMDVARVNIGLARHPGFRDQIRIARRINHYLGENRMPAFLAFENCASHDAVLDDGCRAPRVQ